MLKKLINSFIQTFFSSLGGKTAAPSVKIGDREYAIVDSTRRSIPMLFNSDILVYFHDWL